LEAIKKVDNDPILFVTVARIFWGERRLEKAMTWFEKAIVTNGDLGDAWAWYYKFLLQHGTEVRTLLTQMNPLQRGVCYRPLTFPKEKREDVLAKCVATEPKHGETWQTIAKQPTNANKSAEEILKLVADLLS
jgi:pre-mRNA-processing factor 6